MPTVLQYQCPCCGGRIEFDSAAQQMKCPFCDTVFDLETLRAYDEALKQDAPEEMQWDAPAGGAWEEAERMGVYTCQSCGGELVADENTAATSCPFCGSPVVLAGRLAGDLKPDLVIPFRLSREDAKAALRRHMQGKRLLPRLFRDENHLDEIKGIYVPFWLYDADVEADLRYHATRVRTWEDSRFRYTETSHFMLQRSGSLGFDRVPVDGSSKMPDELMESIEPFDYGGAVDFQTAYLSGYLADRYDVTAGQSISRANERVKCSTEEAFAATAGGYTTVAPEASRLRLLRSQTHYALCPVWLLTTSWRGQRFTFAVNGQTGRLAGNLPMDKAAYWRWWAIWSVGLGAVVFLLLCVLHLAGVL